MPTDDQAQWWDEERDRFNDLCDAAGKLGLTTPLGVGPSPKLNSDGSLASEFPPEPKEATENCSGMGELVLPVRERGRTRRKSNPLGVENTFCAKGKGGGIDPHCGKEGGGATGTGVHPTPPPGSSHIGTTAPDPRHLEQANIAKTLHPNVHLVNTPGGTPWVVKGRAGKGSQVKNEVLATSLSHHSGVDVAPVHHVKLHGQDHLVAHFQEGKSLSSMNPAERKEAVAKVPKEQLDKHALHDYAIGNKDPNTGNYMVKGNGHMVALDKEQTLEHGVGKGTTFRVPEHLDHSHEFDREHVKGAAHAADNMAADLESRGHKEEAKGVRNRAAVLREYAAKEGKLTAGGLAQLGESHDKKAKAAGGFFGKLKSAIGLR